MPEGQVELIKDYDRPLPTWVPGPIRERAINQKVQKESIGLIKEELRQDLRIEENLPGTTKEKIDRFHGQIATAIIEAATELHLPLPRTRTTQIWSLHRQEQMRGETSGKDASVLPDEYVIRFHPGKIEEMLELGPFSQKIEADLVVRHEMLHLWEIIHLPEVQEETKAKLESLRIERPEIYQEVKQTLTGKEMRAKMFELEGLKGQDAKTVRQFLYKSLIILLTKLEISQREKRRRHLGISF